MNSFKESVKLVVRSLRRFLSLSFIFASMILVVRLHDLVIISNTMQYPVGTTLNMLKGIRYDMILYLQISAILSVPFLIIAYFSQKAAKYFFIVSVHILTLAQIFLIQYFSISWIPFSTGLENYSLAEFLRVFRFPKGVPVFSYLILMLYLTYMTRVFLKHVYFKIKPWAMAVIAALMISSVMFSEKIEPKRSAFNDDFGYHVAVNKLHHFIKSLPDYYLKNNDQ